MFAQVRQSAVISVQGLGHLRGSLTFQLSKSQRFRSASDGVNASGALATANTTELPAGSHTGSHGLAEVQNVNQHTVRAGCQSRVLTAVTD